MLPNLLAAWGTIRGAWAHGVAGAIAGSMVGGAIGVAGFLVFMWFKMMTEGLAFRDVPNWCSVEFIMASGGGIAGFVVGLLAEWASECAPKPGSEPVGQGGV